MSPRLATSETHRVGPTAGTATAPRPTIPYGRQTIDEEDIAAVVEALRAPAITTGPRVPQFEEAFAAAVGTAHAVAVSSGTAALHAALYAVGVGPADEVIVPPMTFAASANAAVFLGATPVFADVDPGTLLLDPQKAAAAITPRTKAIVAVDYAGQPCDYDALRALASSRGLALVADACHAPGATYRGRPVGSLADVSTFSFHPVKHLTTGEGGMITTDDADCARRLRMFRNHGINADYQERAARGSWFYEMVDLGYNYRLTDVQCALGLSQMRKLPAWLARRRDIAGQYDAAFRELPAVRPLLVREDVRHAYHLYVVRVNEAESAVGRDAAFAALRQRGIGVNVHYIPVHLHPYYRRRFGTRPGRCPVAEAAYREILSLPMFPALRDDEVEAVIAAVREVTSGHAG